MRIGYCGNFQHPFCTEVHVKASLEELGHNVSALQENTVNWRALPRMARARRFDLILWTRTWDIDKPLALEALAELRKEGVPTASFHLDRWWGLDREYQIASEPFFQTDVMFSPDGGSDERWAEAGINHHWLPPGVFGQECAPVDPSPTQFPHDVIFVGSHPYPHREWEPYRSALIARMREEFGERFGLYPADRGRPVRGLSLQRLYASAKVVIGDSCLVGNPTHYWSDRIPETLGRGGLLIHPEVEGLEEWYADGEDLLTYPLGDYDRVVELAHQALEKPEWAKAIAEHGRATVLGRDTYKHRMASVIEVVQGRRAAAPARPERAPQTRGPDPSLIVARHAVARRQASFAVAQGDTDAIAVKEVWGDDQYKATRPDMAQGVVVDIGANVGAFSVLAVNLGARVVHAYEPHPESFAVLVGNLERNSVGGRVVAHNEAVYGAASEGIGLIGDGGGAHIEALGSTAGGAVEGIAVPAVGINEVLGAHEQVAFLKLDCEGSEYPILEAVDPDMLLRVARLVMEFHGGGMPHLTHLADEGAAWGRMVTKLATYGRVQIFGRPTVGGLLWWQRY